MHASPKAQQHASNAGAHGGSDRRHGAQQTHHPAGAALGRGIADHAQGHGHHDGCTKALQAARGNQRVERGRAAAQPAGQAEQQQAADSNPRPPRRSPRRPALRITAVIASRYASTTHCTGVEGRVERLRQAGQAHIGEGLCRVEASSMDSDRLMRTAARGT